MRHQAEYLSADITKAGAVQFRSVGIGRIVGRRFLVLIGIGQNIQFFFKNGFTDTVVADDQLAFSVSHGKVHSFYRGIVQEWRRIVRSDQAMDPAVLKMPGSIVGQRDFLFKGSTDIGQQAHLDQSLESVADTDNIFSVIQELSDLIDE